VCEILGANRNKNVADQVLSLFELKKFAAAFAFARGVEQVLRLVILCGEWCIIGCCVLHFIFLFCPLERIGMRALPSIKELTRWSGQIAT
jgi:hypothetical protein